MSILGRVGEHPNFWGDIWESKFGQVSGQLNARFWPSRPLSRQLLIAVKAVFSCMHSSVNEIYLLEDKLSHTFFMLLNMKKTIYIFYIVHALRLHLKRFCPRPQGPQHWGDVDPCESENLCRHGSQWAWDLEKSFDEPPMEWKFEKLWGLSIEFSLKFIIVN